MEGDGCRVGRPDLPSPSGVRCAWHTHRMRVPGFVIAEVVRINEDGPIDIRRGWPEWWWLPQIAGDTVIPVMVVVETEPQETAPELQITIEDSDHNAFVDITSPISGAPEA